MRATWIFCAGHLRKGTGFVSDWAASGDIVRLSMEAHTVALDLMRLRMPHLSQRHAGDARTVLADLARPLGLPSVPAAAVERKSSAHPLPRVNCKALVEELADVIDPKSLVRFDKVSGSLGWFPCMSAMF